MTVPNVDPLDALLVRLSERAEVVRRKREFVTDPRERAHLTGKLDGLLTAERMAAEERGYA